MDDVHIIERYKSRRNCVNKVEILLADGITTAVMKEYNEVNKLQSCTAEYKRLERLLLKGMNVPRPYGIIGEALLMEYIPGVLINDFVERLEGGRWIEELALWFNRCHSIKLHGRSLVKGDVNLRNFVFFEGKVYGLDFEEDNYGDPINDIADVCFFILTNTPSLTKEKDWMTREFLKEYAKLSGLCPDNIAKRIFHSKVIAAQRRRSMNIQSMKSL